MSSYRRVSKTRPWSYFHHDTTKIVLSINYSITLQDIRTSNLTIKRLHCCRNGNNERDTVYQSARKNRVLILCHRSLRGLSSRCCSSHEPCAELLFRLVDRPRAGGEWRRHLGHMDEGDLFMELIRDVSNELDIDVLCHKILVNVGLLTSADRGSLFLARGPPDNRYLVAKLFDVTVDTGQCHLVFVRNHILLK